MCKSETVDKNYKDNYNIYNSEIDNKDYNEKNNLLYHIVTFLGSSLGSSFGK